MKEYRFRDLLEVYLQTRRKHVHEDFDRFYAGQLDALERAFFLRVRPPEEDETGREAFEQRAIWLLFGGCLNAHLSLTESSGVLEEGLILHILEERPNAKDTFAAMKLLGQARENHVQASFMLLEQLFAALYGPREQTVTSRDLLALGFDDSRKPDESDYWEHY